MKLRLTLLLLCLLGIGMFGRSQTKKPVTKPTVENGPDAIPVIVKSHKRSHHLKPLPPPPPPLVKSGKPWRPPPKVEIKKFAAPKDAPPPPVAPGPAKVKKERPVTPETPPLPVQRS